VAEATLAAVGRVVGPGSKVDPSLPLLLLACLRRVLAESRRLDKPLILLQVQQQGFRSLLSCLISPF